VRLFELAYCCNLYSNEEYDRASLELHDATGPSVDPGNEHHVAPLFNWLRRWGCRQFAIGDEAVARASLVDWWSTWGGSLPPSELALDEVDDSGLDVIAGAYDDLRARQASWQRLPSGPVAKTFGPTGAAKTLYAIRPRSCSPWDDPIRKWLGVRVTAEGYRRHVVRIGTNSPRPPLILGLVTLLRSCLACSAVRDRAPSSWWMSTTGSVIRAASPCPHPNSFSAGQSGRPSFRPPHRAQSGGLTQLNSC
jgi:hypothetical protein